MKNLSKLIFSFFILGSLACFFTPEYVIATFNETVTNSSDPYQYIIFNKVDQDQEKNGFSWNPHNINTLTEESIKDVREKMPELNPNSTIKVGLQLTVPYFNITHPESVALIKTMTELSQKYQMPILFRLDGFIDWDMRDDLWKWWAKPEPGITAEDIAKRKDNVEWTDWTSDSAIGISWRNWAWQMQVPPQPNLCSKDYRQAKEDELTTLMPIIQNWYQSLASDKKYLFAGVVLDTELSIGVNYYYYPDSEYTGRDYTTQEVQTGNIKRTKTREDVAAYINKYGVPTGKNFKFKDPNNPPDTIFQNSNTLAEGPNFGRQQLGYAAVKDCGIKNSGTITAEDLNQVVNNHAVFLAGVGRRYFPADKVFVHGMWNHSRDKTKGFSSSDVVTGIVAPGLTLYGPQARDFPVPDIEQAINANQKIKFWGATEYQLIHYETGISATDMQRWFDALNKILKSDGNKLVDIYNWKDVKNAGSGKGVFEAIENIVNADPAIPAEDDNSLFALTEGKSSCQTNSDGKIVPVINLSWDPFKGATDYNISRAEIGAIGTNSQPKSTKGELKFTDFDVTPGKLYFYLINPVISTKTQKSLASGNIPVGECDQGNGNITCNKSYQEVIVDESGKQICIDRACEDRTNNICTLDNKCMLTSGYWGTGCTMKVADTSSFIATYGTVLESAIALLCQKTLNNAGIYLDDHLSLCKQKASDKATGCLNSVDVNDFTGCIQRATQQTIDELTPGAGQVVTTQNNPSVSLPAGASQPEQQVQRVPTHVYLQIPDGEVELPISGGSIGLPIKDNPTVVRVRILFDKPDQSGSNEVFRSFTVTKKTAQEITGCDPNGDIVPPGHPDSWTFDRIDCDSTDPNNRGQRWVCGNTVKYAYGENCPPKQESYEETLHSAELKSQCKLCKYSQYVNGEVKCFNGVPEDPNKEYGFNNNCIWVPECGTDPVPCP